MSERNLAIRVNLSAVNTLTSPLQAAQRSAAALAGGLKTTQQQLKGLENSGKAFETLTRRVDKQTAAYEKARAQVKNLTATYPRLRQQTGRQKKNLAEARKARQQAGRELDRQKQKLRAVSEVLERHGVFTRRSSEVTERVKRRTDAYNRSLATQKQRLEAVTRAQRRYTDAKKTRDKLMAGGAKATATGAALLYGAGKLMAPGRDFGAQVSKVQALLDLNKDDAALAGLRAQARQMGASTRYTATEAATAQSVLAAAGLTPEAIRASLQAVLNLADAGDIGLEESAGLGATVASQFELPASAMGRISDTLIKTAKSADTNLTILAESFKKAGSAAHMAGLSVEETGVLFDSMADAGIKGAPAGTAVAQMLNGLITPSEKGQKALAQLGITVRDQTGRMKDFRVIAGELGEAMQGFDRAGQMQILTSLFGESATIKSGSLAVIKALRSGKFDRLLADSLNAAGVAAKDAAVMADNLEGDLLTLQSAWQDLGIELSDNVDSPLRQVTQSLTGVINRVKKWMTAHPQLTKNLMLGALAAGALTAAAGTLAMTAASVLVPLAALRLSLSLLGVRGIGSLLPKFAGLSRVIGRLPKSLTAALSPLKGWGRVAGTVSRSAGRLTAQLRGFLALTGGGLHRAGRGAGKGLSLAFRHPLKALKQLTRGVAHLGLRGFGELWRMAAPLLNGLLWGISALFSPVGLLVAALVTAAVLIYQYWEPVKAFFAGFFKGFSDAAGGIGETVSQAFAPLSPLFEKIAGWLKTVWEWLGNLLTPVQLNNKELKQWTDTGEKFGHIAGAVFKGIIGLIEKAVAGIAKFLRFLGLMPETDAQMQQAADNIQENLGDLEKTGKAAEEQKQKVTGNGQAPPPAPAVTPPALTPPATGTTAPPAGNWGYGGKSFSTGKEKGRSGAGSETSALRDTDKPGDIVFKNRPALVPVSGLYREPQVMPAPALMTSAQRMKALPQPVKMPLPPATPAGGPAASYPESPTFILNFYGVKMEQAGDIARTVRCEIEKLLAEQARKRRSRFA